MLPYHVDIRRMTRPQAIWPGGSVRRVPPVWIGLTLAFVSAVVTNTAYSLEHDAAGRPAAAGRMNGGLYRGAGRG